MGKGEGLREATNGRSDAADADAGAAAMYDRWGARV